MVTDVMTEQERAAIIREVAAQEARIRLAPGEFTASQYACQNGVTHRQAQGVLKRALAAGIVTRREDRVLLEGNWQWAYSQEPPKR